MISNFLNHKFIYFLNENILGKIAQGLLLLVVATSYEPKEFSNYFSALITIEVIANLIMFGSNSLIVKSNLSMQKDILKAISSLLVITSIFILVTYSISEIELQNNALIIFGASIISSFLKLARAYFISLGETYFYKRSIRTGSTLNLLVTIIIFFLQPEIENIIILISLVWLIILLSMFTNVIDLASNRSEPFNLKVFFKLILPFAFRNNLSTLARWSGFLILMSQYEYEITATFALFMRITEQVSSVFNFLFLYFLKDIRDQRESFWRYFKIQLIFAVILMVFVNLTIEVIKAFDLSHWYFQNLHILQILLISTLFGVMKTNFAIWEYWDYSHAGWLIILISTSNSFFIILGNYFSYSILGVLGLAVFYLFFQFALAFLYFCIFTISKHDNGKLKR